MTEPRPTYRDGRRRRPPAPRGPNANAAIGRSLEELLEWQHREYERLGRAVVLFHGTKTRARKGKDGEVIFVAGPSLPDYGGTLAGGRAIAFDAKSTADEQGWTWPRDRLHQRDTLSRLAGVGTLAFVLLECRPRRAAYLVPVPPGQREPDPFPRVRFDDQADLKRRGVLVVPADELEHYDWLGAIEVAARAIAATRSKEG